jgi:hypothetical protein
MDDMSSVYEWAKTYSFDEVQLQYATIIALEILDDASDMDYDNYNLFISMYEGICDNVQVEFNGKVQQLIALSRGDDPLIPKKEYKDAIHNLRIAIAKDMDESYMELFKQLVWDNQN